MPVRNRNNAERIKRVFLVVFLLFVAFFVLNLGAFSFFTFMVLLIIALLCFRCSANRAPDHDNHHAQQDNVTIISGRVVEPEAPQMTAEQKQELLLNVIPAGVVLKTSDEAIHADFGNEIVEVEPSCPVCLVEFEHSENVLSSPSCPHVFHNKCILEWLANHNDCPICRRQFVAPELLQQQQPSSSDESNPPPTAPTPEAESSTNANNNTETDVEAPTVAEATVEPEITVSPVAASEEQTPGRLAEEAPLPDNPLFASTMTADERISKVLDLVQVGEMIAPHRFALDDSQAVTTCEDATECPICHKDYTTKEILPIPVIRSPNPHCRHIGCRECMTEHLIHTTNCTCPSCERVFVNASNNYSDEPGNESNV